MRQKDELEAGALVIKNIAVIEQAIKVLDNVWSGTWSVIEPKVASLLKESGEEWISKISENENNLVDDPWFSKVSSWLDKEKKPIARFWLLTANNNNDDHSSVTQLCGLGESNIGISWMLDYSHKAIPLNKKSWKSKSAELDEKEPYTKLKELGFKYCDASWFLPMQIDSEKLSEAWLNDEFDDVLEEMVSQCMEKVLKATPIFDEILKEVRIETDS